MSGITIAIILYLSVIAICEAIRIYKQKNGVVQIIEPSMFMEGKVNIVTQVIYRGKPVHHYFHLPNDYEETRVRLAVRKEALEYYKNYKKTLS